MRIEAVCTVCTLLIKRINKRSVSQQIPLCSQHKIPTYRQCPPLSRGLSLSDIHCCLDYSAPRSQWAPMEPFPSPLGLPKQVGNRDRHLRKTSDRNSPLYIIISNRRVFVFTNSVFSSPRATQDNQT